MSGLQTRIDRLERRAHTSAGLERHDGRLTPEGYFNALTTREEREAFLVLVQDVHAVQQRESAAHEAGRAIPPRSGDEQARIDELDRCLVGASS